MHFNVMLFSFLNVKPIKWVFTQSLLSIIIISKVATLFGILSCSLVQ